MNENPVGSLSMSIDIQEVCLPYVTFSVRCSKGDLYSESLQGYRGKSRLRWLYGGSYTDTGGVFDINDALTLKQVESLRDSGTLFEHIRSIDSVFTDYPAVTVSAKEEKKLYNGNPLPWNACTVTEGDASGMYRVYDKEGHFIGIYRKAAQSDILHPDKLFFDMP